jgi:hypothetical protein
VLYTVYRTGTEQAVSCCYKERNTKQRVEEVILSCKRDIMDEKGVQVSTCSIEV